MWVVESRDWRRQISLCEEREREGVVGLVCVYVWICWVREWLDLGLAFVSFFFFSFRLLKGSLSWFWVVDKTCDSKTQFAGVAVGFGFLVFLCWLGPSKVGIWPRGLEFFCTGFLVIGQTKSFGKFVRNWMPEKLYKSEWFTFLFPCLWI